MLQPPEKATCINWAQLFSAISEWATLTGCAARRNRQTKLGPSYTRDLFGGADDRSAMHLDAGPDPAFHLTHQGQDDRASPSALSAGLLALHDTSLSRRNPLSRARMDKGLNVPAVVKEADVSHVCDKSEKITFVHRYILYSAYRYTSNQFIDKVIKYFEPQNCHNDKIV